MKTQPEQPTTRTVVIGNEKDTRPTMRLISYTDGQQTTADKWIPDACIASTQPTNDDATVFFLEDAEVNGINIAVTDLYTFSTNDASVRDMADIWIEFGELPSQEVIGTNPFTAPPTAVVEGTNPFNPFTAPPTVDDTTPVFDGVTIDLADFVQDDEKEQKLKQSAIEKAAAAREARYAEAKETQDGMKSDISKAMAGGKRHEDFGAWNFNAEAHELVMQIQDPLTGEMNHYPVRDSSGNVRMRCLVNPSMVDEDNPQGVVINRAIGANYAIMQHPTVFKPVIEAIDGINSSAGEELITWDAFSFNKGARAMLNLDLTGFSKKTRKESAQGLDNFGYVNLSANRISDMLVEEEGGHRVGVSIINAHDGKSALQAFMTVLRTYCGNLAMRGGVQNIMKHTHTTGSMASFDPLVFADRLASALYDTRKHMVAMSVLRHLPIEMNMFDKVLNVFGKHGLISQPSVRIAAGDSSHFQDEKGNIVVNAGTMHKDAVKIAGGHAYNAVLSGWMNPDLDYVALTTEADKKAKGTMFHAMQSLTGTITHNPIWSDGKRILHGNTQGVETMMKRSSKATDLAEATANANLAVYANHTGQPVDDLEAMGEWFSQNPDKMVMPFSKKTNGKMNLTSMKDINAFQEDWSVTVVMEAKA